MGRNEMVIITIGELRAAKRWDSLPTHSRPALSRQDLHIFGHHCIPFHFILITFFDKFLSLSRVQPKRAVFFRIGRLYHTGRK
jgi:hypothetical protein